MPRNYDGWEVLAGNLRRLMFEQHISQRQLAEKADMEKSSVSLILSGSDLRVSTLNKLGKALGVDPWTLLIRPEDKPHDEPQSTAPSMATEDIARALSLLINLTKGGK